MPTWMLVEDEPSIYESLLAMYEIWGVDGVSFTTGEDAISWIEAVDKGEYIDELPQLALLDIRLPDERDGIDIGERLRQSPNLGPIPIVLMSGYRMKPKIFDEAMARSGANLFVPKPLPRVDEFREMLYNLLPTHT